MSAAMHNLPDGRIERLRDQGRLVCRCSTPELVWLALWCDYQCNRCGKAVVW